MKTTIRKIIIAAAFFAAGLLNIYANIPANAAGSVSCGTEVTDNTATVFICAVSTGYPEGYVDDNSDLGPLANAPADAACNQHPLNTSGASCGVFTNFTDEYIATYADLSVDDIFNFIEVVSGRGATRQEAIDNARANCESRFSNCDCLLVARDINTNAIPLTFAMPFTAADAGNRACGAATIEPEVCGAGTEVNEAGDTCVCINEDDQLAVDELGTSSCAPPPENSGNAQESAKAAGVVGGILGMVAIVHYFNTEGGANAFSFSPAANYSITESGYAASFGGRAEYEMGDWDLYWTAGQTNTDGRFADFRYESGGKYTADIWTATFSESVAGETADYDLSLSADWRGNLWRVSPTYRFHSSVEPQGGESESALRLEGAFLHNRWTINPSAGFEWRQLDDFGASAKFRINAVHRF